MTHSVRFLAIAIACTALAAQASADDFNKAGRTVFQFVKIGIGARQAAIGEAAVAVVRDANAIFWNPAMTSGIESAEASFSYTSWFADLNYFAGAAGVRWEGVGVFSLSYASMGYGDLQEALVTSRSGSSDTRTGGTFTGSDLMVGVGYARDFTDNLALGISVKYLRETLFSYKQDVFAFDVGSYYNTGFKGIRIAMAAQNFAPSVKFMDRSDREEGYDLPLLFRIGAAIDVVDPDDGLVSLGSQHRLALALETVNSNDYGERWHIGGEYMFGSLLALRAGYRLNYEEGNLSFGAGVNVPVGSLAVRVDYSYVSYEFLESPHRLTLTLAF